MKISAENDNGPYETIFDAFDGYNVRIVKEDGTSLECQIIGSGRTGIGVKLFVGDEDVPTGKCQEVLYDDIEEVVVY